MADCSYYVTEPGARAEIEAAALRAAQRGGRVAVHLHRSGEECSEGCHYAGESEEP